MAIKQTRGTTGGAGLIQVDVSSLNRAITTMEKGVAVLPRVLNRQLTMAAKERLTNLRAEAPVGKRPDEREPVKLRDSFSIIHGSGVRTIVTSTPNKLALVVSGTAPHYIYPLHKKAIRFPGTKTGSDVIVPWIGPPYTALHPGTKPNDFVARAESRYDSTGGDDRHAQLVADLTVIAMTNISFTPPTGE